MIGMISLQLTIQNGDLNFYISDAESINDPISTIKRHWATLKDGSYVITIGCGSEYAAVILHSTQGRYGAVYFVSYALSPTLITCVDGIWSA